jgi:hypothetical protein
VGGDKHDRREERGTEAPTRIGQGHGQQAPLGTGDRGMEVDGVSRWAAG